VTARGHEDAECHSKRIESLEPHDSRKTPTRYRSQCSGALAVQSRVANDGFDR
jgi:hypothetical protein